MVMKREGWKIIISQEAQARIDKGLCPVCAKPKRDWNRRGDWRCCSPECTEQFNKEAVTFGWGDLRLKVFLRDAFTCRRCGKTQLKMVTKATHDCMESRMSLEEWLKSLKYYFKVVLFEKRLNKSVAWVEDTSSLIADHITPIALNGAEWDLNNIQTLCIICNKIKTRNDAGDIAVARKVEKVLTKGQKVLL